MISTLLTRKAKLNLMAALGLACLLAVLFAFYSRLSQPLRLVSSAAPRGYSVLYSIYGFDQDRLYRPEEVAVDGSGNLYIADTFKHRIVVFDARGRFAEIIGTKGSGYGELKFPSGVAVSEDGVVFALSYTQNKVVIFDKNRKAIWEIRVPEPETATVRDGRLYLATARGVMVGDLRGNLIRSFGRRGSREGEFDRPTGIAVDSKGDIFVADSLNYRVQAFDKNGKFKWSVGGLSDRRKDCDRRRFGLPVGLAVDDRGFLYLVDAFAGELVILDRRGKQVGKVGDWGNDDGQFYFPSGISFLGNEKFAVADTFNDRIQVVHIPSPIDPKKPSATDTTGLIVALLALALAATTITRFARKRMTKETAASHRSHS